ncbi:MAG: hypothetical protein H6567_12060 [Lewinellaceae bacterium]|nr:hypothetical protein [Lewinellaceae bacterium]
MNLHNPHKIKSIYCIIFTLFLSLFQFAFGQDLDLQTGMFTEMDKESKDFTFTIKNINVFQEKIEVKIDKFTYQPYQPFDSINGAHITVDNAIKVSKDNFCDTFFKDTMAYIAIRQGNKFDEMEIDSIIVDFKNKVNECDKKASYMNMLTSLLFFKANMMQTYHINMSGADGVDITVTVTKKDGSGEISKQIYNKRVHKEKFWAVSMSAGVFLSKNKYQYFDWQGTNTNDTIFTLSDDGYFRLIESKKNAFGFGLNLLTHLQYYVTSWFSAGIHVGLGSIVTQGTNNILPQVQYGFTVGLGKDKRFLINLGSSFIHQATSLDSFISTESIYSNAAQSEIKIDDHIRKSYKNGGFTISATYQI